MTGAAFFVHSKAGRIRVFCLQVHKPDYHTVRAVRYRSFAYSRPLFETHGPTGIKKNAAHFQRCKMVLSETDQRAKNCRTLLIGLSCLKPASTWCTRRPIVAFHQSL